MLVTFDEHGRVTETGMFAFILRCANQSASPTAPRERFESLLAHYQHGTDTPRPHAVTSNSDREISQFITELSTDLVIKYHQQILICGRSIGASVVFSFAFSQFTEMTWNALKKSFSFWPKHKKNEWGPMSASMHRLRACFCAAI